MPWTTPTNMTVGQVFTATRWNTQVAGNFDMLKTLANNGELTWSSNTLTVTGSLSVSSGISATNITASNNIIGQNVYSNAFLGVGITSPDRIVHVRNSGASARFDRGDGVGPGFFLVTYPDNTYSSISKVFYMGGIGANEFGIRDHGTTPGGGGTERLKVTNSGSVLIGRTSGLTGAGDLDVNGALRVGNGMTLSNGGISALSGTVNAQTLSATGNLNLGGHAFIGGTATVTSALYASDFYGPLGNRASFPGGASFFSATGYNSRPSVPGSRGGNIALANLLTVLHQYGLILDNTTA